MNRRTFLKSVALTALLPSGIAACSRLPAISTMATGLPLASNTVAKAICESAEVIHQFKWTFLGVDPDGGGLRELYTATHELK
jgi:hypothetical protein